MFRTRRRAITAVRIPSRRPRVEGLEARIQPSDAQVILIEPMYQQLLGRTVAGDPVAQKQEVQLQKGGSIHQAALAIQGTVEGRTFEIQAVYQALLGRPATTAEVTAGLTLYQKNWVEKLEVQLAAGGEFFSGPGGGTNGGFVEALYQAVYHRTATGDPHAADLLTGLTSGKLTRTDVSTDVFGSTEYFQGVVHNDFETFLGRAETAAESTAIVPALVHHKKTDQQVIADLIGSPEYYILHLPAGPQGPQGPAGPQGDPATVAAGTGLTSTINGGTNTLSADTSYFDGRYYTQPNADATFIKKTDLIPTNSLSGTISGSQIADGAVTSAKLAGDSNSLTKVSGGDLTDSGGVVSLAPGVILKIASSTATASAANAGALRFNTSTGHLEYSNGSAWVQI